MSWHGDENKENKASGKSEWEEKTHVRTAFVEIELLLKYVLDLLTCVCLSNSVYVFKAFYFCGRA